MSGAGPREGSGYGRPWQLRIAMAGLLALFCLHALLLSAVEGFRVVDDAYITFRYIDQWLAGHGLVFNPGDRVDGYSNFLWLLLLTPFRAAGLDPVRVSQALGLVFGAATLVLTIRLTERFTGAAWLGLGAGTLLALDGSFARWAIDGLETPLFTLLVTAAVWLEFTDKRRHRRPVAAGTGMQGVLEAGLGGLSGAGLVLGLAALTRPEGGLVFALIAAYRVLAGIRATLGWGTAPGPVGRTLEDQAPPLGDPAFWRQLFALCFSFTLVFLPWFTWHRLYYDAWLPNTAYVKLEPGLVSVVRGLQYTAGFLAQRGGWIGGLLLALAIGWRARRTAKPRSTWPLRLPLGLVLGMTLYVVGVGGDWMNRGRFFVPVMPMLVLMLAEGVARARGGGRIGDGYPRDIRAAALLVAMAVVGGYGSSWRGERPWMAEAGANHLEREAIIDWLRTNAPANATLLAEEVGEIPFYTGLVTFDVYGLTDRHIARHGHYDPMSAPGHQKSDLNHSLGLEPDFLIMAGFRGTWERNTRGERVRYPGLRAYEPVELVLPVGRLEVYRRRASSS